jgi:hypothetical protein
MAATPRWTSIAGAPEEVAMTRCLLEPHISPPDTPGAAPLVALGPHLPAWVRDWCRASGRALEQRPGEPAGPDDSWSSEALTRSVGSLAGRTIWLAREPAERVPSRVVAALDDLAEDAAVLDEACRAAGHLGATLVLAHAVPVSFAERSVGLDTALTHGRRVLAAAAETAAARLPGDCLTVSRLVRARPHELVGEPLDADLLVLGGPRLGADERSLGVVLTGAVFQAPCPVLLAPRATGARRPS